MSHQKLLCHIFTCRRLKKTLSSPTTRFTVVKVILSGFSQH